MAKNMQNLCHTCLCSDRRLVCVSKIQSIINEIQLSKLITVEGSICWVCHKNIKKFHKFIKQAKTAQDQRSRNTENVLTYSLSGLTTITKHDYDYEFTYSDPLSSNNDYIKTEPEEPDHPEVKLERESSFEFDNEIDMSNSDSDYDEKPLSKIKIENVSDNGEESRSISNDTTINEEISRGIGNDTTIKKEISRGIWNDATIHEEISRGIRNDTTIKEEISRGIRNDATIHEEISRGIRNDTTINEDISRGIKNENTINEEKSIRNDSTDILKETFKTILITDEEILENRKLKENHPSFKRLPYKCDSCVMGFLKKEHYELHVMKKHDQSVGPYVCEVCNTRFSSELTRKLHAERHRVRYECALCGYRVSLVSAAAAHARTKHADAIHCNRCDYVASEEKHKELKKELKRKRNCERQRAYYQRQKNLKKNEEKKKKKIAPKTNAERQREFRQRKAEKSYVDI